MPWKATDATQESEHGKTALATGLNEVAVVSEYGPRADPLDDHDAGAVDDAPLLVAVAPGQLEWSTRIMIAIRRLRAICHRCESAPNRDPD